MDTSEVINLLDRKQPDSALPGTLSSGSFALDTALGGGYRSHGLVELYGDFATYKTTMALYAVREAQQQGEVLWLDSGDGFNVKHAGHVGVDTGKVAVYAPMSAKDALLLMRDVADEFPLMVVDSAAMLDYDEGEDWWAEFEALRASKATVLFINVLRPGLNEFSQRLRYFASQRVNTIPGVSRGHLQLVVTKNSFAAPHQFDIQLRFNQFAQMDSAYEVARLADKLGVFELRGTGRYFGGHFYRGLPGVVSAMNADPQLAAEIRQAVTGAVR